MLRDENYFPGSKMLSNKFIIDKKKCRKKAAPRKTNLTSHPVKALCWLFVFSTTSAVEVESMLKNPHLAFKALLLQHCKSLYLPGEKLQLLWYKLMA